MSNYCRLNDCDCGKPDHDCDCGDCKAARDLRRAEYDAEEYP